MEEVFELELTGLAYGGDAMGRRADGQVVFVSFGIPGEVVRVRLQPPGRGGPARAEIVEILARSPERTKARCVHFGSCGGCHYQHMEYQAQLKAKTEILSDQLRRIGKLAAAPVRDAVASATPWNYRNNIQFHLTSEGKPGFIRHPAVRGHAGESIFPVQECHLPVPELNELWPQLEFEAGTGIQRLSVRSGDELMVVMESDQPEPPRSEERRVGK